jgi:hypothetical protein
MGEEKKKGGLHTLVLTCGYTGLFLRFSVELMSLSAPLCGVTEDEELCP